MVKEDSPRGQWRFSAWTVEVPRVDSGGSAPGQRRFRGQWPHGAVEETFPDTAKDASDKWQFEPRTRNCSDVRKLFLLENSESHCLISWEVRLCLSRIVVNQYLVSSKIGWYHLYWKLFRYLLDIQF